MVIPKIISHRPHRQTITRDNKRLNDFMCRSVLQIVKASAPIQSFDKGRTIVAQKGVVVSAPWIVLKSQQYEGRYFFFNTETKKSEWTLHESFCQEVESSSVSLKSNKVQDAIKTFPTKDASGSLESLSSCTLSVNSSSDEELSQASSSPSAEKIDILPKSKQQATPTFSVVDGLGQGGYATVVQIIQNETGKKYAMKVVSKSKVAEKHRDVIAFELQVMTAVSPSPFLQRCHLAFENNFNIYFLLDLHTGGDLFHHLLKRCSSGKDGFEEKDVQIILAELYLALEHLHNHNIIHRDIKIENVMLDGNGHVKLIDFGLSKQITNPVEEMPPAGSFIYMAPELILDHQGGRHSDWWAFGVMAFELLTGRTPWSSLTDQRIIKQEIQSVNVSQYLGGCSPSTRSFVCSLMNRNFMQRLGTTEDCEIMNAPFFTSVNWEETRCQESEPAFVPETVCTSDEARKDSLASYRRLTTRTVDETMESWILGLEHSEKFLVE